MSPRGLTLRQLWSMAEGRRRESRVSTLSQAVLVWALAAGEVDEDAYLRRGTLAAPRPMPLDPELQANVDRYIQVIVQRGKLILEG